MEQNYFYSAVEPEGSNRIDCDWLKVRLETLSLIKCAVFELRIQNHSREPFSIYNANFRSSLSGITTKNVSLESIFDEFSAFQMCEIEWIFLVLWSTLDCSTRIRMLMRSDCTNILPLKHSLDSRDPIWNEQPSKSQLLIFIVSSNGVKLNSARMNMVVQIVQVALPGWLHSKDWFRVWD